MRPFRWRLLAAAGMVFLVVVLARFPAPWLKPLLPAAIQCPALSGSIWSGECAQLTVAGTAVGDTAWTLRAAPLLRGRVAGSLAVTRPGAHIDTKFELGLGGSTVLENVHAQVSLVQPLYRDLLPRFSAGDLSVDLARLSLRGKRIREIRGRIDAHGLVQPGRPPTPLGSYEVRFDSPPQPNGDVVGVVHDLGGPIAFDGTLKLTPAPGFRLEGRVAARADADPSLERTFRFLGTPDADGRRQLAEEGSF
jgi:hypothetical protein